MQYPTSRRDILAMGLAAALPSVLPLSAHAQAAAYPNHPIRLILGVPPGGTVDILSRGVAQHLTTTLGQAIIIDNKPGASNKIATDFVAKSAPDGYTLMSVGSSAPLTEAAALATGTERMFDTMRDFIPVAMIAGNTYALAVTPALGVNNVQEFIAFAKKNPGYINYGSAGVAKNDHVAAEMFAQATGIKMVHVPFKGVGESINQMLAGRVHAGFSALAPMQAHIRAGKLKLLAIVSSQRSRLFPDVPTIAEAVPLPGYAMDAWIGVVAPAKTPMPIVDKLSAECAKMLKDDSFIKTMLVPNGLEPFYKDPAAMRAFYRGEVEQYTKLFKTIGLKLDS